MTGEAITADGDFTVVELLHPVHFVHPDIVVFIREDGIHYFVPLPLCFARLHHALDHFRVFEFHETEHVSIPLETTVLFDFCIGRKIRFFERFRDILVFFSVGLVLSILNPQMERDSLHTYELYRTVIKPFVHGTL